MKSINLAHEGFNNFRVQQTTGTVDTFTEHTVYVSTKTWGINDWVDYGLRFTLGDFNEHTFVVLSSTANSITCNGSFTGQIFPGQFPFDFSSLSNDDIFQIISTGKELDSTSGGYQTFPLMLGGYFKGIILADGLISTQPIHTTGLSYNAGWIDEFNLYSLIGFPYSFRTQFNNPVPLTGLTRTDPIKTHSISYNEGFNDGFGIGTLMVFPFRFGYTQTPLWGPYLISGNLKACVNSHFNVNATVRFTNKTSGYVLDARTNALGQYEQDLSDITLLYSDGDDIEVSTYNSQNQSFTIDYYDDVQPRILDDMTVCFTEPAEVDTTNLMDYNIKKAISGTAGRFSGKFENKNGRRSGDYASLQPITIKTTGNTVFKGKLLDVDLDTNHILGLTAEDYNGQLHNNYLVNLDYVDKTIYYALTDSTYGILPNYLPDLDISQIPNNADTQRTFSKVFHKVSVADALTFLGDISSDLGYIYYINKYKTFHFEERRLYDSGITLSNTGSDKNVLEYNHKNTGQDIYNRVVIYGASNLFPYKFPFRFGTVIDYPFTFPIVFGGRIIETIDDKDSQTTYGIRENPPYNDAEISSVTEARYIGNNILRLKSNPVKDIEVETYSKYKKHTFDYTFPISMTYRSGILDLEPGDMVTVNFTNAGIPTENVFPWSFSTQFSPQKKVIREIEHKYPGTLTKLNLSEYYKDLKTLLSSNIRREYK